MSAFAAAGCNDSSFSLAWAPGPCAVYGAGSLVVLYDAAEARVRQVLAGHAAAVQAVRWASPTVLLTGDDAGALLLWRPAAGPDPEARLEGHTDAVTALAATADGRHAASASSDGTVRVWALETHACVQTLTFGRAIPLCVALAAGPYPILAAGATDRGVHVFVSPAADHTAFARCAVLRSHSDWVRALSFGASTGDGDLLLATGGQDAAVRLWRFGAVDSLPAKAREAGDALQTLALSKSSFVAYDRHVRIAFALESVLLGHQGWVTGLEWRDDQRLLSTSMDRTMAIWALDDADGVWNSDVRVGEVGGQQPGFYGGVFSTDGNQILAHSFRSALHLWQGTDGGAWSPQTSVTGHRGAVVDAVWDPSGRFFVTASQDQTLRVFGRAQASGRFHEMARPLTHGHDMTCVALVPGAPSPTLVAGAEEKVLRVLVAPEQFRTNMASVAGVELPSAAAAPVGAAVPALGLSNKAIFAADLEANSAHLKGDPLSDQGPLYVFEAKTVDGPPLEQYLLQNSLWPEQVKLYGHGNEIVCVAADHAGTHVATACKSQSDAFAGIRVWDARNGWAQVAVLAAHKLTVTQLEYSPSDALLLSVSRDRHFALHRRTGDEYALVAVVKAHDRIIWACAWLSEHTFATGSRDKRVKVWSVDKAEPIREPLQFPAAVTALAARPASAGPELAVGLESGEVRVGSSTVLHHAAAVRRLRWQPGGPLLLSVSSDRSIRIYECEPS